VSQRWGSAGSLVELNDLLPGVDAGRGVLQSFEPRERWVFRHVDNDVADPVPEEVSRSYR
jgi:hypothetical protein